MPHLATCIFLFFYNEPELGVEIDPGMDLTPLPSSIGRGSNPRLSDCELSATAFTYSVLPLLLHTFRRRMVQTGKKLQSPFSFTFLCEINIV